MKYSTKLNASKPLLASIIVTITLCASGCQSVAPIFKEFLHGPGPAAVEELREGGQFRVLKTAATGSDKGFALLGLKIPLLQIPTEIIIVDADRGAALRDLYDNAGLDLSGRSTALANVVIDTSPMNFLAFSIPMVTVTADIIEFTYPEKVHSKAKPDVE